MASPPSRRPSFGMLLRRTKSGDFGKSGKKAQASAHAQALKDAQQERQRQPPPKLPDLLNSSDHLATAFPDMRSNSAYTLASGPPITRAVNEAPRKYTATSHPSMPPPPVPPIPFDPYARSESMTHRGRYSYASSAVSTINSPRRVRRRKDPTPFNILIVGTRGAGKTSFLEFLKTALALPANKRPVKRHEDDAFRLPQSHGGFVPHYLETEIDSERVGLTLWDSEGLDKTVVDLQLRELSYFVESKFEETFAEEMKVVRSPGVQDTHIHAVLLLLDPARIDRNIATAKKMTLNGLTNGTTIASALHAFGGLDEDMDLQVLRMLHGRTTVIPVIAKADTITSKHMTVLKRTVWDSIKKADLDPLEALGLDVDHESVSDKIDEEDEDETDNQAVESGDDKSSSPSTTPRSKSLASPKERRKQHDDAKDDELPFLPLSIISPDLYETGVLGRRFPWGFADPYNTQHCDFQRLKEAVFSEWRTDLRESSRDQWYEGWRTSRLKQRGSSRR
ncbi:hypothetical protein CDD81_5749 [Ophiocordyceps australis]|uniref:Septin-type G domain-containing protein n=1 Tax=Ophiocordyceps australis TaxID=1399860 RepID=A0A2C5Y8I3_9HYPO|nr:hypothetical protein CDD81_5749 [Ophiocordyceps australis]